MKSPNRAFESERADKQRAFALCPWRRAAQRERSAGAMIGCTPSLISISTISTNCPNPV